MKEPIEYLGNVNSLTTREELYRIGKQMQIDAYCEGIETVRELSKLKYFAGESGYIDEETIRDLKRQFKNTQ